MKRFPIFIAAALLSAFALTGGWCERYEAKQRRFEYKKHYLDSMRVKANRQRDSARAAEAEMQHAGADSVEQAGDN